MCGHQRRGPPLTHTGPAWVFARLGQPWVAELEGNDATEAVEAQAAGRVATWLLDNVTAPGVAPVGLAEGLEDALRALAVLAGDGPAGRSAVQGALTTPVSAANLVARLQTLGERLARSGPVVGLLPPTRLVLLVLHRRADCVRDGIRWLRKARTTPKFYLLGLQHRRADGWAWGLSEPYTRPTNLVERLDSFHGRLDDLAGIARAFERTRLVTLVGPPGAGKTRLAEQYARHPQPEHAVGAGGVHLIDASLASTTSELLPLLVRRLGMDVGASHTDALADRVGRRLRDRGPMLLLLDNLEQLCPDVTAWVDLWLRAAPRLRILVTSRLRLAHPIERALEVDDLGRDDAIALLRHRLDRDDGSVGQVVDILGGRPLFLELAARRATEIGSEALAAELARSGFATLGEGSAGPKLDATLRWSWQALDLDAARTVARCSVFRGSFTAMAAAGVTRVDGVSTVLDRLCEAHVVRRVQEPGPPRYRLLPAVQAFAARQLDDRERTLDQHADTFGRLALEHRARELRPRPDESTLRDADVGDLSLAFERLGPRDPDLAAWVAASTAHLMRMSHPLDTVEAMLARALDLAPGPAARAVLLLERGICASTRNDGEAMRRDQREAVALARRVDDPWLLARALIGVGRDHLHADAAEAAARVTALEEAIVLAERHGHPLLLSRAKATLANFVRDGASQARLRLEAAEVYDEVWGEGHVTAHMLRADAHIRLCQYAEAVAVARRAVETAQSSPTATPILLGNVRSTLARCLLWSHAYGQAAEVLEAAVEGFTRVGHTGRATNARYNLCVAYLGCGRFTEARDLAASIARLFEGTGQRGIAQSLRGIGALAAGALGDHEAVRAYVEELAASTEDDPIREERLTMMALLAEPVADRAEAGRRRARLDTLRAASGRHHEVDTLADLVGRCLEALESAL